MGGLACLLKPEAMQPEKIWSGLSRYEFLVSATLTIHGFPLVTTQTKLVVKLICARHDLSAVQSELAAQ